MWRDLAWLRNRLQPTQWGPITSRSHRKTLILSRLRRNNCIRKTWSTSSIQIPRQTTMTRDQSGSHPVPTRPAVKPQGTDPPHQMAVLKISWDPRLTRMRDIVWIIRLLSHLLNRWQQDRTNTTINLWQSLQVVRPQPRTEATHPNKIVLLGINQGIRAVEASTQVKTVPHLTLNHLLHLQLLQNLARKYWWQMSREALRTKLLQLIRACNSQEVRVTPLDVVSVQATWMLTASFLHLCAQVAEIPNLQHSHDSQIILQLSHLAHQIWLANLAVEMFQL